jgi:pimeloyl-ACP methyl ester carboxylesterase
MVLIEPIFLPERFYALEMKLQEHPLAAKVIKRTNQWENEKEALDYLKSKALFDGWDQRILHLYIKYGMQKQDDGNLKLTCSPQSEAALYMGGRKNNPWPLIPRITCPVLLVEGERSDNKKIIDLKKAASTFPKGEYECVEAAGHLIPMQKPEEIVKIIKKFIANNFQ